MTMSNAYIGKKQERKRMHTKKLVKLICGLSVLIIISGCASTVQYVPLPDQTKKIEDPNKARIYVARPTSFGSAIPINISDGGKLIGHTGPNGYLCWERDPGKTELKGKAENTSTLTLNMEKGTVYYVQQHINMGFFIARNKLRQMIDDEGEKKVAKCKSPTVNSKLSSTSFAQFGAGIKTISGTISFTKNSYDGDDYTSILKIAPSFGYFLFENLAVNISIDKRTSFYPKDWDRDSISSTKIL